MKKYSIFLLVSVAVSALIFGIAVGYYLTPQYTQNMLVKNMNLGQADNLLDLRYINAMIAHHRGAILLAQQAEKSQRQEIVSLAKEIQVNEPKLISELYSWKKQWYGDVRPVADPIVVKLGNYDDKFDLRFLNALIAHHDAGILMTQEVRQKSSRTEIINNADAVETFLKTTAVGLKQWRQDWYNL